MPPAHHKGPVSLEETLQQRRSVRSFAATPLALAEVAQLLWAEQGVTHPLGYRTTPSAGALQLLVIYLVASQVTGLAPGVYRYQPVAHVLIRTQSGELRQAPAVLAIAAEEQWTVKKYGSRGPRYVQIEAGHVAQNVYLQATARGLGTVLIGVFDERQAHQVLGLPRHHTLLGLMPLGHRH